MAKLTISADHPQLPKGDVFDLGILGALPNGGSIEVDDEQQEFFKAEHGMTVTQYFKGNAVISTKTSKEGGD